jgi:hypothetical protein
VVVVEVGELDVEVDCTPFGGARPTVRAVVRARAESEDERGQRGGESRRKDRSMPGPLSHVDPPDARRLDPSAVIETVPRVPARVKPQTWKRKKPPRACVTDVVHAPGPTRLESIRDDVWTDQRRRRVAAMPARVRGLVAAADVTIIAVEPHGDGIVNVVYRGDDGQISDRLLTAEQAAGVSIASGRRWTFDADGASFKLASEARRIELAHLFDPFAAVGSSTIQPLPHQIDAVYGRLLPLQPLRFLLADDPGAGKTIMSGLYIRELMLRGDLERCLVIAPGSLVEQWQEELFDKFDLRFDIMSRDMVEAARTGNPFQERNLLIARLDQLSRSEELQAKLAVTDWDLVICDEAHKMSARLYGDEINRTLRFQLGELVRDRARNLLLLTATPHNGSNDDFLLFLSLLDPDRFAGSAPSIEALARRVRCDAPSGEGEPAHLRWQAAVP